MEEVKNIPAENVAVSRYGNPPENKADYNPYDIYRGCTKKERRMIQEQIEADTIKFIGGLTERMLPDMKNVTVTDIDKDGKWMKPRKATMKEKNKLLFVTAQRQARLQAQIDWLHREQEKHRQEEQA